MTPLTDGKRTVIIDDRPSYIEVKVTLLERYEIIQKIVSGNNKAARKHKEELFGSETDFYYSEMYNEVSGAKALNIDYTRFKTLPIHDRAKMLAQLYLSNMIEIVQRHDSIVKQNTEKLTKNGKT